jgi:hypothetical protein
MLQPNAPRKNRMQHFSGYMAKTSRVAKKAQRRVPADDVIAQFTLYWHT